MEKGRGVGGREELVGARGVMAHEHYPARVPHADTGRYRAKLGEGRGEGGGTMGVRDMYWLGRRGQTWGITCAALRADWSSCMVSLL